MINILRTELFRLKKSPLFWVMLGVCAGLPLLGMLLSLIILSFAPRAAGDPSVLELLRSITSMRDTLNEVAGLTSNAVIFSVIVSAVFLCGEFSNGTIRNILLANKSRKQVYFSFAIISLIIGASYLLAMFASLLLFEGSLIGFDTLSAGQAITSCLCSLTLGLLAVVLAQSTVMMFLFATRNLGATIALPILFCLFAPVLVQLLIALIELAVGIQGGTLSANALTWFPFANAASYDSFDIDGGLVGKISMYYVLFSALFIGLGFVSFEKCDLK